MKRRALLFAGLAAVAAVCSAASTPDIGPIDPSEGEYTVSRMTYDKPLVVVDRDQTLEERAAESGVPER